MSAGEVMALEAEANGAADNVATTTAMDAAVDSLETRLHPWHHRLLRLKLARVSSRDGLHGDGDSNLRLLRYCRELLAAMEHFAELREARGNVLRCKAMALVAEAKRKKSKPRPNGESIS